jgi:glycerol uptake facilitator-like aquaporin
LKRCPQCNRVEADDALVFCRTDGAALVTSPPAGESSTAQLDASEVHTSILPHNTDAAVKRVTGPTTSMPATSLPATSIPLRPPTGTTQGLSRTGRRRILIPVAAAILLIGIVLAVYSLAGRFITPAKDKGIESVAVLPFENKSSNADSEYLSDGLTESLIYRLSQLSNLKVSPRSSVFRYKRKEI